MNHGYDDTCGTVVDILKNSVIPMVLFTSISPDKARKGVIYPLKTGIYALVGISERTYTR